MDFDNVLSDMGRRQRYQQLIFYLLSVPCTIMSVMIMFNIVFLSATPDHWCRVPELEKSGLSPDEIKNVSLPWETRDGVLALSKCKMYDINYTLLIDNGLVKANDSWPQTNCKFGWNFDRSVYQETLVTQIREETDFAHHHRSGRLSQFYICFFTELHILHCMQRLSGSGISFLVQNILHYGHRVNGS